MFEGEFNKNKGEPGVMDRIWGMATERQEVEVDSSTLMMPPSMTMGSIESLIPVIE